MKGDIELFKKVVDFTDFLKCIQLKKHTVFKFPLCFLNGTPECRSPKLLTKGGPLLALSPEFKRDDDITFLFHDQLITHFSTKELFATIILQVRPS